MKLATEAGSYGTVTSDTTEGGGHSRSHRARLQAVALVCLWLHEGATQLQAHLSQQVGDC